jgi:hypothetical protein
LLVEKKKNKVHGGQTETPGGGEAEDTSALRRSNLGKAFSFVSVMVLSPGRVGLIYIGERNTTFGNCFTLIQEII